MGRLGRSRRGAARRNGRRSGPSAATQDRVGIIGAMRPSLAGRAAWLAGWLLLALAGSTALVRADIAQRRDAFQADARTAHRLLGQRVAQHDAILATLGLLAPAPDRTDRPEQRLPALHPQVLAVLRRDGAAEWPDAALAAAEARSRTTRGAVLAGVDPAGRYDLVLAAEPASFALRIDLPRLVPWDTWPIARDGPVAVELVRGDARFVLVPGTARADAPAGLTPGFTFAEPLDSASQPFELRLRAATGPAQWPWASIVAWSAASAVALAALAAWRGVRAERERAEGLLRIGRVARLNAMGELAAGVAHELNQPLAAALAQAQAARRLLDDDPPQLATAREAMSAAAVQARRAADVVARMRRLVEAPEASGARRAVALAPLVRDALGLLEPQLRRHAVRTELAGADAIVLADPVALEQIVHNLLANALQALQDVPVDERRLVLETGADGARGTLVVRDSGPGIAPDAIDRVFEPFWTTRPGGLGLGLGLSASLAEAMGGTLTVRAAAPRGAAFRVALPLAADEGTG
jgi:signal transduction histidine kinase